MAKTLILMRHGKAKRPVEDEPDINRQLSEAGERSLAATLPASLKLMPKNLSVQVCTSPAARAEQTANIMHRCCKDQGVRVLPNIELLDSLWSQDSGAFLERVSAIEADVVLAVGHNPFIEELTEQLCGSYIDFATGGFAAIALGDDSDNEEDAPRGRLLWFAQGPVSQRWRTLVRMERILAEASDAVVNNLDAFFENPEDIETAHKLRVSIRTLRSLVDFISPWQKSSQGKAVQADLKSIVGCTSRLRELDVFSVEVEEAEDMSSELLAFCREKAAQERRRVIETLASKPMMKRLERSHAQLGHIAWRKRVCEEGVGEDEIRIRFDDLAARLEADLAALDLTDVEATHDVRKRAKQVRYDAEKFVSLIGDDAPAIAKGMTAHQDNLGAICDARVNIGIIDSFTAEDLPNRVALDLGLLRARIETFLYMTLRDAYDEPPAQPSDAWNE